MKMKREIIVLVLIIAALSVYIVLKKKGRTHYEIPALPGIEKEEISSLTIREGGEEMALVREGDGWIIRPGDYPADTSQVDGMLELVTGLTLTAMASEAGNDQLYELDESARIEVEAGKGDDVLRRVYVGKTAPSQRHTFVKLDNDQRIYHARENMRSPFQKDAETLRDKQVMQIEDDITEVILTEGQESLHVVKSDVPPAPETDASATDGAVEDSVAGEPEWRTEAGQLVNGEEIDTLIQTLSNLTCDGYVKDDKPEEMKNPTYTVSLKGIKDYELAIYGEQDKKFVCTSSENDYVFLIPEWRAKRIRLDIEELMKSDEQGT